MADSVESVPYEILKPLPLDEETCPFLCQIFRITTVAMTSMFFCFSVGVVVSLIAGVSIIFGAFLGGVVGLTVGVVFPYFNREQIPLMRYLVKTMDQLKKIQNDPALLRAIEKLKTLFNHTTFTFERPFDLHTMHQHLTLLARMVKNQREDIKDIVKTLFHRLSGQRATIPDGDEVTIRCELELKRLEGKKIKIEVDRLDPTSEQDLNELVDLEKECFGKMGTFTAERVKELLAEDKRNGCVLVRRSDATKEILGFAWYRIEEREKKETYTLMGIGHKAEAVHLKIGTLLLSEVVKVELPIYLQVRKSNETAIHLYERFGFGCVETTPDYYHEPDEDGYLMVRTRPPAPPSQPIPDEN